MTAFIIFLLAYLLIGLDLCWLCDIHRPECCYRRSFWLSLLLLVGAWPLVIYAMIVALINDYRASR